MTERFTGHGAEWKDADLSLASDSIMRNEVITAERLLFSSGMTITRSKEIGTIRHIL